MKTDKFARKPFYVEAIRVTDANLVEVAKWCNGTVQEEEGRRYIQVEVHMPMNERQTKAFSGDWVLYANKGYKVYQNKSFWASFDKCEQVSGSDLQKLAAKTNGGRHDGPKTNVNPALMKQQQEARIANQVKKDREVARSAKTGEFVSKEEAVENPDTTVTEVLKATDEKLISREEQLEAELKEFDESIGGVVEMELDTPIPDVDSQITQTELPADASLA